MSFAAALKELELNWEGARREPLGFKEKETLYAAAYGMYEVGDYEKGADLFTLLVLNEPYELRFWKGLAATRQMQRDYKSALQAWSIVCLLGGHPPISHFHAAECFLSLGELKEAERALQCAEHHLQKNETDLSMKIAELKMRVSDD